MLADLVQNGLNDMNSMQFSLDVSQKIFLFELSKSVLIGFLLNLLSNSLKMTLCNMLLWIYLCKSQS
jgi:hypothetical protein